MAWKNVQYENGKMRTSSGGSGGASNFADLEDVDLSNLQDGQVPKYNATTQKWENANESGGSSHSYSTTEQVVGTWIDGKPLYEKTYVFNSPVSSYWGNTGIPSSTFSKIIGCVMYQDNGTCVSGTASMDNANIAINYYTGSSYLDINAITLQYTKASD